MSSHQSVSPPEEAYSQDNVVLSEPHPQILIDISPPTELMANLGDWAGPPVEHRDGDYGTFRRRGHPPIRTGHRWSSLYGPPSERLRSLSGPDLPSSTSKVTSISLSGLKPTAPHFVPVSLTPTERNLTGTRSSPLASQTVGQDARALPMNHLDEIEAARQASPLSASGKKADPRKMYKCDDSRCATSEKTWDSISALRKHQQNHAGHSSRRFSCETCGRSFLRNNDLERHMLVHSGEFFLCPHEGCKSAARGFRRRDHLKRHLDVHHPYSSQQTYPCGFPSCPRSFESPEDLHRHERANHLLRNDTYYGHHEPQGFGDTLQNTRFNKLRISSSPSTDTASPNEPLSSPLQSDGHGAASEVSSPWKSAGQESPGEDNGFSILSQKQHLPRSQDEPLDISGTCERSPSECHAAQCAQKAPNNPHVAAIVSQLQSLAAAASVESDAEPSNVACTDQEHQNSASPSDIQSSKEGKATASSRTKGKRKRSFSKREDDDGDSKMPGNGSRKTKKHQPADNYFMCVFCTTVLGFCKDKDGNWCWWKGYRICDLL